MMKRYSRPQIELAVIVGMFFTCAAQTTAAQTLPPDGQAANTRPLRLIAKFIAQGSASGLDSSCVDQIKRPPFLTEQMARQLATGGPKLDASTDLEEWEGILDAGAAKLRLVPRVAKNAAGAWTGELISIDQNNARFSIDEIKYQDAMLSFEVRIVGGSFKGAVKGDGSEITGDWNQGGRALPLVFKRASKPASPR